MPVVDDIETCLGGGEIDSFGVNFLQVEDNILANDIRELNCDFGVTIEGSRHIDRRIELEEIFYMDSTLDFFIRVQAQQNLPVSYNIRWPNTIPEDHDLLEYRDTNDALEWTRILNLEEIEVNNLIVDNLVINNEITLGNENIVPTKERKPLTLINKNVFTRVYDDIYYNSRFISVINERENGPEAFYLINKSGRVAYSHIVKLTGSSGIGGPHTSIDAKWEPETHFEIGKRTNHFDGDYSCRRGPLILNNPVTIPNGVGLETVVLLGVAKTTLSPTFNTKYGNQIIMINNTGDSSLHVNGDKPTAVFFATKNRSDISAYIQHTSRTFGVGIGIAGSVRLELSWGPDEELKLNKNNSSHDGEYFIQYALDPVHNDVNVGVTLVGTTNSDDLVIYQQNRLSTIISVDAGITGTTGVPIGIFGVSKSDRSVTGQANTIAQSLGISSSDKIAIDYPINDRLHIRKTGTGFDGEYNVKVFHMNN